jgi:hypothetical protein
VVEAARGYWVQRTDVHTGLDIYYRADAPEIVRIQYAIREHKKSTCRVREVVGCKEATCGAHMARTARINVQKCTYGCAIYVEA